MTASKVVLEVLRVEDFVVLERLCGEILAGTLGKNYFRVSIQGPEIHFSLKGGDLGDIHFERLLQEESEEGSIKCCTQKEGFVKEGMRNYYY